MANMSYCRFENTYKDLQDCYDALGGLDNLSGDEKMYALRLIGLCKNISDEFGDVEDEDDVDMDEDFGWICNNCDSFEYTLSVSEDDIDKLGCSCCGGDEFYIGRK